MTRLVYVREDNKGIKKVIPTLARMEGKQVQFNFNPLMTLGSAFSNYKKKFIDTKCRIKVSTMNFV